jgi:hypothetical protein
MKGDAQKGAPERVWLDLNSDVEVVNGMVWDAASAHDDDADIEYIRADVVAELVEAMTEMAKEAHIIRESRPGLRPHPLTVAAADRALSRYAALTQEAPK